MQSDDSASIDQAAAQYVDSLKSKSKQARTQQELFKFAKWFGAGRSLSDLKPFEIGEYGEKLGARGAVLGAAERIGDVRKFLAFARKKGLIEDNLAQHLKLHKGKGRTGARAEEPEKIEVTLAGHNELENELDDLRSQRAPIAKQIQRAAADKDVRENVPLEAAREQLGHVESRITQIESTLRSAIIVDSSGGRREAVGVGSKVVLKDLESGRQKKYTVVSAIEANPLAGKISDVSPVGKALVSLTAGQEVEVDTPRGKQRYRILKVSS